MDIPGDPGPSCSGLSQLKIADTQSEKNKAAEPSKEKKGRCKALRALLAQKLRIDRKISSKQAANKDNTDISERLPPEIRALILRHLDPYDQSQLALVSDSWRELVEDHLQRRPIPRLYADPNRNFAQVMKTVRDIDVLDATNMTPAALQGGLSGHTKEGHIRELHVSWEHWDVVDPYPVQVIANRYIGRLHRLVVTPAPTPEPRYISREKALHYFAYICELGLPSAYMDVACMDRPRHVLNGLPPDTRLCISRFLSDDPRQTAEELVQGIQRGEQPILSNGAQRVHGRFAVGQDTINVAVVSERENCQPMTVLVF